MVSLLLVAVVNSTNVRSDLEEEVARQAILGLSPVVDDELKENLNLAQSVVNDSGLWLHLGCLPSLL